MNSRIIENITKEAFDNGKFTIELPRNIIDSKGQGIFRNVIHSKYIGHIIGNGFGVTYNEISISPRTLAINFGEIKGTGGFFISTNLASR
jgi:hypothetical protein